MERLEPPVGSRHATLKIFAEFFFNGVKKRRCELTELFLSSYRQPPGRTAARGTGVTGLTSARDGAARAGRESGILVTADGLIPDGAHTLVRYEHPHFSRFPAITIKEHGHGRVTYVGTLPDVGLTSALLKWAVDLGIDAQTLWRATEPSQTVTSATNQHGERVHFVHNWAWEPSTFVLPTTVIDAINGKKYPAGEPLPLDAWDVRVLVEQP